MNMGTSQPEPSVTGEGVGTESTEIDSDCRLVIDEPPPRTNERHNQNLTIGLNAAQNVQVNPNPSTDPTPTINMDM